MLFTNLGRSQIIQITGANLPGVQLNQETILSFQLNSTYSRSFVANYELQVQDLAGRQVIKYWGRCNVKSGLSSFSTLIITKQVEISGYYREFMANVGVLPPGEYQVCLSIETVDEPLRSFEDCFFADSYPNFDLILNLPENGAVFSSSELPFFQWLLVSHLPIQDVDFEFKVVQKLAGQQTTIAIVNNPILFKLKNLKSDNYLYQTTNFPLNNGNTYAWTVNAFYKGFLLAQADPNYFEVKYDSLNTNLKLTNSYIDVRDGSGGNYFVKEAIKLSIRNFQSPVLKYEIIDSKTNELIHTGEKIKEGGDDFRVVISLRNLNLKANNKYKIVAMTGEPIEVYFTYVQD